jgi:hypothetical protein
VFRKLGHAVVIVALIAAIGGHWAILQTVAWTTMLADNLRAGDFSQAVAKTFDGKHPCALCKAISAGKKAEQKAEFSPLAKKLEFVSNRAVFLFAPPQDFWLHREYVPSADSLTHAPALPPPRSLFV